MRQSIIRTAVALVAATGAVLATGAGAQAATFTYAGSCGQGCHTYTGSNGTNAYLDGYYGSSYQSSTGMPGGPRYMEP